MSFASLIRAIWRKKLIIISVPLVLIAMTYFISEMLFPSRYRSVTQLSIDYAKEVSFKQPAQEHLNIEEMIKTIQSPLIIDQLSYSLLQHALEFEDESFRDIKTSELEVFNSKYDLKADLSPADIPDLRSKINDKASDFKTLEPQKDKLIVDLLQLYDYDYQSLLQSLNIYRITDSDLMAVEFISEDPELSAFAVNTLANELIRFYEFQQQPEREIKVTSPKDSDPDRILKLTRLVEQRKDLLDQKTAALNDLKRKSLEGNNNEENASKLASLNQLNRSKNYQLGQVKKNQDQIEELNQQIQELQKNPSMAEINQRIINLKEKINDLNQVFIDQGSNNQEIESTLEMLRKELRSEMNRISTISNSQKELETLLSQRESVEKELAAAQNKVKNIEYQIRNIVIVPSSDQHNYQDEIYQLDRQVEQALNDYLAAINQLNQAKNTEINQVEIEKKKKVEEADSPIKIIVVGKPSRTPINNVKPKLMAMAGSSSLFLILIAFVVVELFDPRVKTPNRFTKKAGFPLLTSVALIDTKKLQPHKIFKKISQNPPHEAFKQGVRKLSFALERKNPEAKIILFVSPRSGDGKSFLILSLANSMSLSRKRILIIDTNFKTNGLTKSLLPETDYYKMLETGTRFITDRDYEYDPQKYPEALIAQTSNKYIDVMGSNKVRQRTMGRVLANMHFDQILQHVSNTYDYIFMEAAALNDYPDSQDLFKYADKMVPVFSALTNLKQQDLHTINNLKKIRNRLTGGILNQVDYHHTNFKP
ncbi:MAG: exopolysaccharide transport family protein [Candidatus Cyclobacteriaceae bacterium M3_2C_046]